MSVNVRPSFKPSGAPSSSPSSRPTYRGGDVASAAYNPTSRFTGGIAGLLIDGIASSFLQSQGGAAAGNADPLGYVTDISGNGNHLNQTMGALRQVNTVVASVNSIDLQAGCNLPCTMASAIDGAYSFVSVVDIDAASTDFLSYYSGNDYVAITAGTPVVSYYISNTEYAQTALNVGKRIIHVVNATGVGLIVSTYDMTGALIARTSVAAQQPHTLSTSYQVGFAFGTPDASIVYQMELNAAIDTADFEANDLPYLVDRFAAWGAV
jgi:hypothetical protein